MECPLPLLKQAIATAWGSNDQDRFPGPQPVSIERRHFPLLKKQPYMVCEKTDGLRQMLVCLELEGKKRCFLVDRAFHVEEITTTLPRDTVFDCERVDSLLLVYDAVMVKGESMLKKPLTERLAAAGKVIRMILRTSKDKVQIKLKKMYPLEQIDEVLKAEYPYKTDGLVFTPVNEPIRMGTHETMFKWKPRETITIDFMVRHNGQYIDRGHPGHEPVMDMYIADREKLKSVTIFNPLVQYKDLDSYEGRIVECGYGDAGWYFIKVRADKTYPNNLRTFERTLVNLREDIQACEFRDYIAV